MYEQITNKETNRTRRQSFFWTMAVLFMLDLLFLLWIFNPIGALGRSFLGTSGGEPSFAAVESEPVNLLSNAAKRSPLGEVAGLHSRQPGQVDVSRKRRIIPVYHLRLPEQSPLIGMDGRVTSAKGPS
jgi:hypothetical protein